MHLANVMGFGAGDCRDRPAPSPRRVAAVAGIGLAPPAFVLAALWLGVPCNLQPSGSLPAVVPIARAQDAPAAARSASATVWYAYCVTVTAEGTTSVTRPVQLTPAVWEQLRRGEGRVRAPLAAGEAKARPITDDLAPRNRCIAIATSTGRRCKLYARPGSDHCHIHQTD